MNQVGHELLNGKFVANLAVNLSETKYADCKTFYFAPFEAVNSNLKSISVYGSVNFTNLPTGTTMEAASFIGTTQYYTSISGTINFNVTVNGTLISAKCLRCR